MCQMGIRQVTLSLVFCVAAAAALASPAQGATRSNLSRWLSQAVIDDLKPQLAGHPRYAAQKIDVVAATDDALSDAVAYILRANFASVVDVLPAADYHASLPDGRPDSIDSLSCRPGFSDYRLAVTILPAGSQSASARLQMVDNFSGTVVDQWQWRGRLSSAERRYLHDVPVVGASRGDLSAPWQVDNAERAAAALSRDFVCALRPHTAGALTVSWTIDTELPQTLADTFRAARHYVAAFRELDTNGAEPVYRVAARAVPLQNDLWQLWLVATPSRPGQPSVEAVTYMLLDARPQPPQPLVAASPSIKQQHVAREPAANGQPLVVELLGVTRSERGTTADLNLRLRIRNQANRPLAYSLRSSGGHFEQCIGSPTYYRHEAYGAIQGVLGGGESRIESLRIEGVRHQPAGRNDVRACAAIGDLGAFQDYARYGYRVTDYLRWEL